MEHTKAIVVLTSGMRENDRVWKSGFDANLRLLAGVVEYKKSLALGEKPVIIESAEQLHELGWIKKDEIKTFSLEGLGIKNFIETIKDHIIQNEANELRKDEKRFAGLSLEEKKIIELIENESLNFDEIVRRLKLDSSKVGTILSMMEMKGIIINSGGEFYLS